jgi:hypothetical protein
MFQVLESDFSLCSEDRSEGVSRVSFLEAFFQNSPAIACHANGILNNVANEFYFRFCMSFLRG